MLIVWRSLIEYLGNNLKQGKSVNVKNFGAFTFDIATELPRIATKTISPYNDLNDQRMERKHVHTVKPAFVVDQSLQMHLARYHGKEQIVPAKSQNSIFQKGFRMIYCNPVPIASACLLGTDVVKDILSTYFLAIIDLIKYGQDLDLQFGFCNISLRGRALKANFSPSFTSSISDKIFEKNM
eukprot:CAMPEP_0170541276 /NCGR_PEP_ID=MMETSP0211-20121228/1045_1 /TAXON_ID=311385 /ORGANISM="Pseudokeronopsis sp., Strain OXSARD2" /LENGTH=181 /DNA_ID=CAMNT_0010843937 /DNA_START=126 /DNA_END=671 /DNA_ORIENTATION=-